MRISPRVNTKPRAQILRSLYRLSMRGQRCLWRLDDAEAQLLDGEADERAVFRLQAIQTHP